MSQEIDFDTLAKFGLNRFTIVVTRSKIAGLKVETQPVEITEIIDAMTELLPGSIEAASMTPSATMMQDGSLAIDGFHKEARPRLTSLLRKGRDAYFTNVLQPMYDDTTRLHIARDVATAVICNGIDPSELAIKMMCGCGTCSKAADLVSFVQSKVGDIAKSKEVFVPASSTATSARCSTVASISASSTWSRMPWSRWRRR